MLSHVTLVQPILLLLEMTKRTLLLLLLPLLVSS